MATSLHDNVVQVASRLAASDSVDLMPAHRVPPPSADVIGILPAPGDASPNDRDVLSSKAVASYVFSGGARNYLTVNDVDDVQLTLNSALEFLASRENVAMNDGMNAMIVDNAAYEVASNAACELVSSAAYEAVPITTECDIASVGICTSSLATGTVGAGRRPFHRVSANVVQSTALSTTYTAVQPANISHYDSDVHAIAINRYDVHSTAIDDRDMRSTAIDNRNVRSTAMDEAMDNRNMRYTAMNENVVRPTAAANATMAEINRFSRSNNNECMQYDGDVCMTSDTMSARVRYTGIRLF